MDISSVWLRCVILLHLADDLTSPSFHSWQNLTASSTLFNPSVTSNSLQPLGLQHTRLLCPRDFPGKNTGLGCHFLLQGNLLDPGIEPMSPVGRFFFYHWATREAFSTMLHSKFISFLLLQSTRIFFFSWLLDLLSFFPSLCHSLIL